MLPICTISADSDQDEPCCWICLGSEGPLTTPCACPRSVHPQCLARWQLQQAGRTEEHACRFCGQAYGDWREQLACADGLQLAPPVMAINVHGRACKLRVGLGPEGKAKFQEEVRELLGYASTRDFDVVFECQVPGTGECIRLAGFAAYDAATHCAAVAATRRAQRKQKPPAVPASGPCSGAFGHHSYASTASSSTSFATAAIAIASGSGLGAPGGQRRHRHHHHAATRRGALMEFVEECPTPPAGSFLPLPDNEPSVVLPPLPTRDFWRLAASLAGSSGGGSLFDSSDDDASTHGGMSITYGYSAAAFAASPSSSPSSSPPTPGSSWAATGVLERRRSLPRPLTRLFKMIA